MTTKAARRAAVIVGAFVVVAAAGFALAADSGGHVQNARDLLAQADAELQAAIAEPLPTVTETATITTTQTITETATATPTPPPPTCTGVTVAPGPGLGAAVNAAPSGTTFCLQAGTYTVNSRIQAYSDAFVGAGRTATFIDGSGLSPTGQSRIFVAHDGAVFFRDLSIGNAPVPPVGGHCLKEDGTAGNASCGVAIINNASILTLQNVDCHDNGGACVTGSNPLTFDNVVCDSNGSPYASTSGFAYGACVKQAAAYGADEGRFTMTGSTISNSWGNGIWCDYCKYASWDIHGNTFTHNGNHAVQWEMSANWLCCVGSAHVYGNTFSGNGWQTGKTGPGGIIISTAAHILVEDNTFDGTNTNAAYVLYSSGRLGADNYRTSQDVVIRNNTLNGDPMTGCSLTGVTCSGNV